MKTLIPAALLMFAASSWGAPEQPASASAQSETAQNKPAQQLTTLERQLLEKQEARDKGALLPDQYQAFVGGFRVELEAAMSRIPPTPANKGLHAQLLSRLGADERQAAIAGLTQALETSPDDPELLRAQAQISYESGDFPAAAEAAKHAWESSGRKDKAAWGLLKMSEGRVAATGSSSPSLLKVAPTPQPTTLDWTIPKNNDISPKAMGFIQSAIAARGRGDMAATWGNAQAAMNADPTSTAVQSFYSVVQGERAQTQETHAFIQRAVAAMGVGNGEEAVAWARKAYERSPGEDTKVILEDVQRRSAGLKTSTPDQAPAPSGWVGADGARALQGRALAQHERIGGRTQPLARGVAGAGSPELCQFGRRHRNAHRGRCIGLWRADGVAGDRADGDDAHSRRSAVYPTGHSLRSKRPVSRGAGRQPLSAAGTQRPSRRATARASSSATEVRHSRVP